MSEELRAELSARATIARLKIFSVFGDVLSGGSTTAPVETRFRVTYTGAGIFLPATFFGLGIQTADGTNVVISPLLTLDLLDKNNLPIIPSSIFFAAQDTLTVSTVAVYNLENYYDNISHGWALASKEWYTVVVRSKLAAAIQPAVTLVGEEYLF